MLTCRDQQAAAYKGSRKINRPATHPIHFVADSPDKIIADVYKRQAGAGAAEECRPRAAGHRTEAILYQRRISHWQAAV